MADDGRQHAVMIIDMPDATADEIQAVFRSVRECAASGDSAGWPEDLAVLVGEAATEISEQVQRAIKQSQYSFTA
jgi:hypothetical protein